MVDYKLANRNLQTNSSTVHSVLQLHSDFLNGANRDGRCTEKLQPIAMQ